MALPQKNTKTVSLRNGQTFQWHLNPDWWYRGRFAAIQQEGSAGQMLFIELFHYEFMPTKTVIRDAIRTAFRNGWTPGEKGQPFRLRYDGGGFVTTDSETAVAP